MLHYKGHKINMKGAGLCIDSLDWIKNKKATMNPIMDIDKCFQYAATVLNHQYALNHKENG